MRDPPGTRFEYNSGGVIVLGGVIYNTTGIPADEFARQESKDQMKSLSKLGTGHGRNEESRVSVTRFDRATEVPAETVAIQYDRRENLIAMGVLPRPAPYLARREPNPFPGALRFAPDPR